MNQEQSGEIPCLDSEQIRALVLGEIPPGRITQFEKHLASCGLCRERLEKESGDPSWLDKVRASLTQPIDANEENNASPASATPPDPVLSLLDSSTHPDSLGKIKDYEILGVLGRGGMGAVLRAFDPGLNRFVALKILSPHLAANATARKRFLREARAAAAIAHENVIAIHGVSEFKGIPYLVMPLIRGDSLQKRMRENGPLELEEVLRIGLQTASGLAAAHSQGLIHRDVKPANILLGPGTERVTLTDFGLARTVDEVDLTQTGMLAGTPRYMSPEQTRGENLDTRSDLFSLGTVLFEMVTGHAPFRGQTTFTLMKSITESHHKPVRDLRTDCPDWLERIIHRLLAKNPIDRFASARDVQRLLTQGLAHLRSPKTETAPATAGFVLPTGDTGATAEASSDSHASSHLESNRKGSFLQSLKPFHWGVAGLLMLVIASIPILMILGASPTERLAIIAVLLSPINLGIIFYAAYRIYLVMFGNSRSKDIGAQNRPGSRPGSPSELDGIKSIRESTLPIYYYFGGFLVLFLTSMALMSFVSPYLSLSFPFYLFLSILILLYSLLFIYFIYLKKSHLPIWKKTLQIPVLLSLILTPLLMVFILEDKFGKIYASRDGYLATLAIRVFTLGQQHPDRQQITAAQTLLMGSGGHQLRDPIGIWYFLIGVAILLGLSGLILVFRKQSTKRAMVYWAGALGGVILVFLILTEWAHQAAIAEMALICNQTFPRETRTSQTYDIAKEAVPPPEPVVRGGSLVAPLVPSTPEGSPSNSSQLLPFPGLPEPNPQPVYSYRPAKPFTIKSLGILPDPENASYFGYEITVPPEQLIAITIYEETPEAKRVRMMGPGGRLESPAYGLIYNPTKEPKRAIWSMSGGKSGKIQLDTYAWRLKWADNTDNSFLRWRNNDFLRESFLGNLDFLFPPYIVPSEVSTEIRLEMVGRDAKPGISKSLGGIARGYIQFRSIPMPMETLQIKPSILNALKEFPLSMGMQPGGMPPGNVPSELTTKPILGMNPKYWEWFYGFTPPENVSRIQLTVNSRNNIKVLGRVGDLDQAVKIMSASGFLTESNIILKHDPLLIDKSQVNQVAENLLAKGYKNVKVEELPKSNEGSGEILLSYPPGRGEDFLKILDPKLQAWNNQQKEKSPKDPVGTLAPLGQTGLLEAKGSYRFLKMLITVFDKAKESKPGEPLSDLTLPITELPTTPSIQLPEQTETNKPGNSTIRPAKPFTIKPLGILPNAPFLSFFGYEITVPPEQLIAIGIFEETPEAKRVRLLGLENYQVENQAYGFLYNPTKVPIRAIWAMGTEKPDEHPRLNTFSWRLNWADQTNNNFLKLNKNDLIRDSFLRFGVDFIYVPSVVPSKESTEIRLEMQGGETTPGMLKALGGKATSYIQFRSLPMPEGTLKVKPEILKDQKAFPGYNADFSTEDLSKPITKPILGMRPKYWEWFSGFDAPKEDSWVQLTVYSLENIKFFIYVLNKNIFKDVMLSSGFYNDTKIKIKYDSVSMNIFTMENLAQNIRDQGFQIASIEELPKSSDGTGEMWFYNHLHPQEALLKIVEPKVHDWNKQHKGNLPKKPEGTLIPLGESRLLKASGSYEFLKAVKSWIDKANEAAILPTVPTMPNPQLFQRAGNAPSNGTVKYPPASSPSNPKEAPAKEPPAKETPLPDSGKPNTPPLQPAPKPEAPKNQFMEQVYRCKHITSPVALNIINDIFVNERPNFIPSSSWHIIKERYIVTSNEKPLYTSINVNGKLNTLTIIGKHEKVLRIIDLLDRIDVANPPPWTNRLIPLGTAKNETGPFLPAKPISVTPLGVLQRSQSPGYEITVPPQQLIEISAWEESPEAKRILSLGQPNFTGLFDNPAYGFIYNPSNEPKKAIWEMTNWEPNQGISLYRPKWKLSWANESSSGFNMYFQNRGRLDFPLFGGLDFPGLPTLVPNLNESTEYRLESIAKEAEPDTLKCLGGKAKGYIQFRSIPMPSNKTNPKEPRTLSIPTSFDLALFGATPFQEITTPTLGMGIKYWEWFHGFSQPESEERIDLTVYSKTKIKALIMAGNLDKVMRFIGPNGFRTDCSIRLVFDPDLVDARVVEALKNELVAKGFNKVSTREKIMDPGIARQMIMSPYPDGPAVTKILEPKIREWNQRNPRGSIAFLRNKFLLEATGTPKFLHQLEEWYENALETIRAPYEFNQAKPPGSSTLKPPLPEGNKNPPTSLPNPKEAPAKESPAKEPAPQNTALKEPLKKDAPLENSPKSENSPKKDSPAKETSPNREALKK